MEKKMITISEATDKLFDRLNTPRVMDAFHDFASDLFYNCIFEVEQENEVDTSKLDAYELWYDDAREEFLQTVDEMVLEFLKN